MHTLQHALRVHVDGQDHHTRVRGANGWFTSRRSPLHLSPSSATSGSTRSPDINLDLTITPATPSTSLHSASTSHFFSSPSCSTPDEPILARVSEDNVQVVITDEPEEMEDLHAEENKDSFARTFGEQLQPVSGRRKGLLVGCRYWGSEDRSAVLGGAYADIDDMKELLITKFGWQLAEFTTLKDDRGDPGLQPTINVLRRELKQLVRGARPGDSLFFMFAGHGGQVCDKEGDEDDGMDEVIETCDHEQLVDDELFDLIVRPLPQGCRLTAVFDCCNSGTALDLPEVVAGQFAIPGPMSNLPTPKPTIDVTTRIASTQRMRPASFRKLTLSTQDLDFARLDRRREADVDASSRPQLPIRKDSHGNVVLWSACQDNEDAYEMRMADGTVRGAMSHAFIASLREDTEHTYRSMLEALCTKLQRHRRHSQVPQLSGSQPIHLDTIFVI